MGSGTWAEALAAVLLACACSALAQEGAPSGNTTILQVQSQLVLVPTTVQTKHGDIIYGLKAPLFEVKADGIVQQVRLDESEDVRPISVAVVVQCSRDAIMEMPKLRGLGTMVDALVGGAPARVAVIDFGTEPELLTNFTSDPERRDKAMAQIQPCADDGGAAIFDAVAYANKLFERAKTPGRRVVLLVSETRDHGSESKPQDIIRALGRTNVVVDAVSFSPGRDEVVEDLKHSDGANRGLFGMVLMAVQALRKNAPKEFARQSGGEYINFASQKKFDLDMNGLANRVHSYYLLTFQPHFPPPQAGAAPSGPLHTISVRVPEYPNAVIHHRESYWENAPLPPGASTKP